MFLRNYYFYEDKCSSWLNFLFSGFLKPLLAFLCVISTDNSHHKIALKIDVFFFFFFCLIISLSAVTFSVRPVWYIHNHTWICKKKTKGIEGG